MRINRDEDYYMNQAEKSDCLREGEDDYFSGPIFTATFWRLVGGILFGLAIATGLVILLLS